MSTYHKRVYVFIKFYSLFCGFIEQLQALAPPHDPAHPLHPPQHPPDFEPLYKLLTASPNIPAKIKDTIKVPISHSPFQKL